MTKVTEGGFKVDPKNGIPAWIQVRRRLVFLILSGKFQPNEQVPTVRELAVELGINYNTVNKVYQDLDGMAFCVLRTAGAPLSRIPVSLIR